MEWLLNSGPEINVPVELTGDQLQELLNESCLIREEDTLISGTIRLIKYQNWFILQEKTTKQEIMIRLFLTEREALNLYMDRLNIYEKMWDGCGCKVDYYK